MSDGPRFRLLPALWTAGQRLRQRWSPIFALAIVLIGFPAALMKVVYAGQAPDWGGLAVGTLVGLVLSGLGNGALAWLALAGGDNPWSVAFEGLGRALYKLSPLAGLGLLLKLPILSVNVLALLVQMGAAPPIAGWMWTGLGWAVWLLPALAMGVLAPVFGVLMFEGGDLLAALRQALRMTRGSWTKLAAVELARMALLLGVVFAAGRLPVGLGVAAIAGATALIDALIGTLAAVVLSQSYLQLHAAAD